MNRGRQISIILSAIVIVSLTTELAFSQNLLATRIRKLAPTKKSLYFTDGIFAFRGSTQTSKLKSIRHSYKRSLQMERIVFDFAGLNVPRIYGSVSTKNQRLYLDFFGTEILPSVKSLGRSKYVKRVDFYPITKDSLSIELIFKENVSIDVFYLKGNGHGRFVADIKK